MKNNNGSITFSVISNELKFAIDKFFHPRSKFNQEDVVLLSHSPKFLSAIKNIKKEFKIPKLNLHDDIEGGWISLGQDEMSVAYSRWFESQNKDILRKLEKRINELITRYNLPLNFHDWLFNFILYGKPKFMPLYNLDLLLDVTENKNEIERLNLTSREKNILKKQVKKLLKLNDTGRPQKDKQIIFNKFNKSIQPSKSKRRPYRTLNTALKTLELNKKSNIITYEPTKNSDSQPKITYDHLLTKIFPEGGTKTEDQKRNSTLRKQHERLLKKLKK